MNYTQKDVLVLVTMFAQVSIIMITALIEWVLVLLIYRIVISCFMVVIQIFHCWKFTVPHVMIKVLVESMCNVVMGPHFNTDVNILIMCFICKLFHQILFFIVSA